MELYSGWPLKVTMELFRIAEFSLQLSLFRERRSLKGHMGSSNPEISSSSVGSGA